MERIILPGLPVVHKVVPILAVVGAGLAIAAILLLVVVALCCCCRNCKGKRRNPIYIDDAITSQPRSTTTSQSQSNKTSQSNKVVHELDFENRHFSYNDLMIITNNFKNNIGTGGFGSVYVGVLENGTQVAVKTRSHSSSQGVKEFMAEAKNLTRVHHVNLVSLLGYCLDENCMALVYEYMKEGTLQDKLRDNTRPLTWKQRLQIAYESALGLEYLHRGCNPPLIHRDVKTNNILLNANLEAKIADFGLSRDFNMAATSVSTVVVGTPGYLDPEYYSSFKLSQKSDVYSFGVVLLEIITGKPAIVSGGHLGKWVRQKLSQGNIDSIVDPRMHGHYDVNSVWKATDVACKCIVNTSTQRPTMSAVVAELKESLNLEIATEETYSETTSQTYTSQNNYSSSNNFISDVSGNSVSDTAYLGHIPAPNPTAR
ncbi:hypothetical protein LUZ63_013651 [Rhynchospora breviuscula]|uniref:Protein kinase domain-containing protein n=1 Tax=Rhynchospora breviuscula TaxID=2022672 RepID=A0A9Q0C8Y0_9POAL|nr:hypothetical protein LUZ63_013651 [Rhynchospora breviuscula]